MVRLRLSLARHVQYRRCGACAASAVQCPCGMLDTDLRHLKHALCVHRMGHASLPCCSSLMGRKAKRMDWKAWVNHCRRNTSRMHCAACMARVTGCAASSPA